MSIVFVEEVVVLIVKQKNWKSVQEDIIFTAQDV